MDWTSGLAELPAEVVRLACWGWYSWCSVVRLTTLRPCLR